MSNQSFADLGVSRAVVSSLSDQEITKPFAIQSDVIGDVLAGRDVLAKSPTGSGKTLAFGVPIVDLIAADARRPAALVLAPTRELATQIVDDLHAIARARALRVTAVYGGVGLVKQAKQAAASHVIVATPGRLEDLLERRAFTLEHIQILVLDEADRMLDMGFRPAVDRIVAACPRDASDPVLLGHARWRRRSDRQGVHARPGRPRARPRRPSRQRRHRAPVRRGLARASRRSADRRARARRRPHARIRAHQARRRPARQAPEAARCRGRRDARQQVPAPARAGARTLRVGRGRRARRDRRRRARHRRGGDLARDQLRSAARHRHLRAPRRPHGPRWSQRHRDHARLSRSASRHAQARGRSWPRRTASGTRPEGSALRHGRDDHDRPLGSGQVAGLEARLRAAVHLVELLDKRVGRSRGTRSCGVR